ncbi:ribosomal RNA-processing protein 14-C-like [Actinia tenebrosa]|uniref:Ribosomal RNA-processing protein 14-C-like n=1 Tax=Actinia tenebrosa TaxID=6105 RepID=A0A6P8IM26_ACTTE|nr:ribosomal RNA-processing protein 14-C-like [Actinia tenebrosa]
MADEVDEELQQRLASHSDYFNSLVRLVPAKFYLPDNEEEKSGKFYKNRKKNAPKQAVKEATRKAKKRRLDPNHAKSVVDLQEEEASGKKSSDKSESEDESDNNDEGFSVEKVPSGKIGDLRARLHERIQLLQGKRKTSSFKKHQERPKKKAKSEIKIEKKKFSEISHFKKDQNDNISSQSAGNKVVNDKGEVVFSKFDFMERNKKAKHGGKARDYKKLLAKAENRKKKFEELKGKDAGKAREVQERRAWKSALEKAEGMKVKDDPKLLKKTLKRQEKQKQKSRMQWKDRKEQQQKQMEEGQKMRQKHLKERAESKKKKGKGKGKKHRPGF